MPLSCWGKRFFMDKRGEKQVGRSPVLNIVIGADITAAERKLKTISSRIKGLTKDMQSFGASMARITAPLAR